MAWGRASLNATPSGNAKHFAARPYQKHWFSVQAVACTEIISFPYTPSGPGPPGPKIGLNHPQIAHVRKTVPFRTPASPTAIRSAILIEADQILTAAACPQMTRRGHSHPQQKRKRRLRSRSRAGEMPLAWSILRPGRLGSRL